MTQKRATFFGCRPVEVPLEVRMRLPPERDWPTVESGSVKRTCDRCNALLWVGPKQQGEFLTLDEAARESALFICYTCMPWVMRRLHKEGWNVQQGLPKKEGDNG